jgi:hypothetical protein
VRTPGAPVEEALVEIVNLREKFSRIHEPKTTLNTGNVVDERT